ncbi:uncharacterized protein LOC143051267 [Mytilus galloprovincialis]|uniref:uncharacterized protein LOC143051267 n=1 Tax=Mytilus galloprovincialis TaxID=29158 RepID=UPI003F7B3DEB
MNLKSADCGLLFKCFTFHASYWPTSIQVNANTNLWCEDHCKTANIDNTFSGTISDFCYCRTTTPNSNQQKADDECTSYCPDNSVEICGRSSDRLTVSKIDRTTLTVTTTISQITTLTSLAIASSLTTTNIDMRTTDTATSTISQITTATSPAIEESLTTTTTEMKTTDISPAVVTTELFRTSSEHLPYSISTVTSQTSTYTNTDVALSTTDRVNQKKMLCECPKSLVNTKWHFLDEMDITDSEATEIILQHFYQNILPEMTVDKKAVTKEVRKRTSAVNKTQPAQFIGWGCIVFLILPVVTLVSIDLLNCCIYVQKRVRRNKRKRINSM